MDITPAAKIEKSGRMRVDPMLRLIREDGQALDNVYAIGDCAACFEQGRDKPVAATAQAAQQEARLLARSLLRQLHGRAPLAFRFRYKGMLVSLGSGKAVGTVPAGRASILVTGLTAKFAYLALYRMHLVTLFGWTRTGALTIASLLRRSASPAVKLHW